MDDQTQKHLMEPIEKAEPNVRAIVTKLLELENRNLFGTDNVTLTGDVVLLIKDIVK